MYHIVVACLILLTGCMMGPNYKRPYIDVPEDYIYQDHTASESLNVKWWEQFDDPILTQLIMEALQNNYELHVAVENIRAAIAVMIQIRSPLFPQMSYDVEGNQTKYSNNSFFASPLFPFATTRPVSTWEALASGNFTLDLWGRTRRLVEAADANIFATSQARQAIILSLVASVANNYILLRGLDEQLHIAEKTKASYKEEVEYFETQFHYGQTSEMSVAQAKTQYEQAAAEIPQIKTQIVQVENAISILLGSNPRQIPRGKSIYDLKMPVVPEGIPSDILCQRPDIMQAEFNLIAENAQIGAAKALYFPTISLTGFYGYESLQLNNLFSGASHAWSYTGSAIGPIFTGGNIYGQVSEAKANQKAALYAYKETIQNAFADVENALIAHKMLLDQIESETRLVEAAGQYQHLATLQYKGGYSPYFVVIQAQEQYFPAQLTWAQTRSKMFSSIVNIYQALGGGWVCLADELTQ